MKKNFLGLVLVITSMVGLPLSAAEVVCVDGNELLKYSQYGQELKQNVEQKKVEIMTKYRQKAQNLIKKLEKIRNELSSGLLSEDAKKEKQKELVKIQQELQLLQLQAQQEIQMYINQQLQKLDKLAKSALKALSQVKGFEIAIDCNSLLYYSPKVDITKDVAKIVDQLWKKENNVSQKR